ncbi:hypothetical protein LCGC14_2815200 [marine sediment metagenome]|uniref:Uncharacterized protein n=1 Tax=marine sediment metagenome TaxID=412755 RepID=A0A0F9AS38_9ZZZZ
MIDLTPQGIREVSEHFPHFSGDIATQTLLGMLYDGGSVGTEELVDLTYEEYSGLSPQEIRDLIKYLERRRYIYRE